MAYWGTLTQALLVGDRPRPGLVLDCQLLEYPGIGAVR